MCKLHKLVFATELIFFLPQSKVKLENSRRYFVKETQADANYWISLQQDIITAALN